jgi:hypothetical protein
MLTTIKIGRTIYKVQPKNESRVMEGYAKAAKIRRKPITGSGGNCPVNPWRKNGKPN